MRDNRRHPAHVCDGMSVRKFAKALQLAQQLEHHFLLDIVGLFALSFAKRVQAQFETNNAFDYRFGMDRNEL